MPFSSVRGAFFPAGRPLGRQAILSKGKTPEISPSHLFRPQAAEGSDRHTHAQTKGRSQTNNLTLHLREPETSRNTKKQNKVSPG